MKRVLILLLLPLVGCGRGGERAEGEGPALPVTVTVATRQPVEERLRLLARIEASEEPLIVAETSGRVVAVHVEPEQPVEVGTVLVELDDRDQRLALERAEAQLERVEALIRAGQRQVERLKNLARRDAASVQALEGAEAELAALQAQRRELQALIESSKLQLERTRITSPIAGTIDRRLVSVGDFLSPGKPVAAIIGRETRRVVVALPENEAPRLRPGLLLRLFPSEGRRSRSSSPACARRSHPPGGASRPSPSWRVRKARGCFRGACLRSWCSRSARASGCRRSRWSSGSRAVPSMSSMASAPARCWWKPACAAKASSRCARGFPRVRR